MYFSFTSAMTFLLTALAITGMAAPIKRQSAYDECVTASAINVVLEGGPGWICEE